MTTEVAGPRAWPPTAAWCTAQLTDFDQAVSFFANWQGRFDQLSRGRFAGKLFAVRARLVRVVSVEANQRVLIRGRDAAGLFSVYPVTDRNAGSQWQGQRLTPGHLILHGPEAETHHCTAKPSESLGLSLRYEDVEAAARALAGPAPAALPRGWGALAVPPARFARLKAHLTRLLGVAAQAPDLLGTPAGYRAEQECVRSLIDALTPAQAPGWAGSPPERAALVRRAEDFLWAKRDARVGAIELCRELGVNDRTLRLAFHERYGLGPMAYFRCLRLNAARAALRAAPDRSVEDVARANGFHHLGNFAAHYRRLFGEVPSAAVRRFRSVSPGGADLPS